MFKKFRKLIISFTIILMILGGYAYKEIPKQEVPKLNVPYSIIQIEALGYSNEEIDNEIIMSFREEIGSLPSIDVINSYAYDNYGIMVVGFEIGVPNAEELNDQVVSIINNSDFEDVVITIDNDFDEADILYVFPSTNMEDALLFEQDLLSLDGVKKVELSKHEEEYAQVTVDNNKLVSSGLDITTLISLISSDATDYTLGYVDDKTVITANNYTSVEELEGLVVGQNVTLGNLAEVEIVSMKNYFNTLNDEDSLYLSIYFEDKLDITTMDDEIRDIASNYQGFVEFSFLPDDVDEAVGEITSTLMIGIALVLVVVLIGLGFRSALTILITFPLTTLATVFVLYILGFELQNISIAGLIISIGIIVDNAIVIVDAIKYHLEQGSEIDYSIKSAIKKNSIPIFTSTLTTIVAFTPLMFLPGVAGQMAFTLPLSVIIALIFSYLSAIFVIPIIASKLVKVKVNKKQQKDYKVFQKILRHPFKIILFTVMAFIISITALVVVQPIELFPTAQKDFIIIDYTATSTQEIDEMKSISDRISEEIDSDYILSAVNYSIPSIYTTLPKNMQFPNQGRIIYIHEGNNSEEIERINEELYNEFGDEITFNVIELMLNDPGAAIEIQLFDTAKLDQVLGELSKIEEIERVDTNSSAEVSSYVVEFDEAKLLQNGLYKAQVEEKIAMLLNDNTIAVMDTEGLSNELIISANIKTMDDLLKQNVIFNNNQYLLSDLITVNEVNSPMFIERFNFKKNETLSVYLNSGVSVYGVHSEVIDTLDELDVSYEVRGEVALTKEVFTNVLYAGIVAFAVIFLILLAQFNKLKNIFIILSAILLSFIGSAIMLIIFDQLITFSVTLGLVSLMGIVVNNGILLLDYIEKSDESTAYLKSLSAVKRRSRAIVISNITTIIGLVPLIINGNDFFRPLAITMSGGLLFAVPLSLIVIPSLYIIFNKRSKNEGDDTYNRE